MNTAVNTYENSNATKTQEKSNRTITVFPHCFCIKTKKSVSKNSSYNKKLQISTSFTQKIVPQQLKSQREFNNKIEKEQVKLSEERAKINEKLIQKFQDDLNQFTEKLTTSFLKKINSMQQEIQYLKNKVKNLFEENMKLKSQIAGKTQEMKPGNTILQLHIMKEI